VQKETYAVLVATRNGEATIEKTLTSILGQNPQPDQVCVVDDGSTDNTAEILKAFSSSRLRIVTRPDRGYDIRRVPSNFNLAWAELIRETTFDFVMISGDDCVYPRSYVNSILLRMEASPRVVVASGRPRFGGSILQEHSPSGSGRLIRGSFWHSVGGYPVKVGWETWLLYRALEQGFTIELYGDLIYDHLRPRGSMHQLTYWGSAMACLGYHHLYALGRIAKTLIKKEVTLEGSINMMKGYLLALFGSSDQFISSYEESLRDFVRSQQARRITEIVSDLTAGI
jgi:glycosyltransferase involved in cell wall biosynthesis